MGSTSNISPSDRRRRTRLIVSIIALFVIGGFGVAAWQLIRPAEAAVVITEPAQLYTVHPVDFVNTVSEAAEVESYENFEVRCEVRARNSAGTKILKIVENGKEVISNEILIEFDKSALEDERDQQQTVVNNSNAIVIQATALLKTAKITLQEYQEGTYQQDEQAVQSEVFVAEENLRRAQEYEQYSQKLAAKGYVTALQLEADRFAVEKARKDLQAASTRMSVLRKYTQQKTLTQLQAEVDTNEAKLAAEENTQRINTKKLQLLEELIAKCEVRATHPGRVQYNNQKGDRGSEFIVEEGAVVREGQIVLRIPNMQKMQAVAKIHESRVKLVRPEMKAVVTADAIKGVTMTGKVMRVDEFPLSQSNFFAPNIRQYAAYIRLDEANVEIRPGMNAVVSIDVDKRNNIIAVPIQAIAERKGHFCVVQDGTGLHAVPVAIGATNAKLVEIVAGIKADQVIVANAATHIDQLDLPKPSKDIMLAREEQAKLRGRGKGGRGGNSGGRSETTAAVAQLFEQHDANHDGVLTKEEIPPELFAQLSETDTNQDGNFDKTEVARALGKSLAGRKGGGGPGPTLENASGNSGGGSP